MCNQVLAYVAVGFVGGFVVFLFGTLIYSDLYDRRRERARKKEREEEKQKAEEAFKLQNGKVWKEKKEKVELFSQICFIEYLSGEKFEIILYESMVDQEDYGSKKPARLVNNLLELTRGNIQTSAQYGNFHTFDWNTTTPTVKNMKDISIVTFSEPESIGFDESITWSQEDAK